MSPFRRSVLGLALVGALVTAACGSSTSTSSEAAGSAGSAGPLGISAPAVSGGTVDLADYSGRDTIAWFWAPW